MMKTTPPNVVWILLDQCRTDVLGCYGHDFIQTPNIDRLARAGVLFENAFCQNPVCVPSRSSLLSGQYAHQNGVFDNSGALRAEDEHLLHTFGQAGYHTANVGKIHVGLSAQEMGFQEHRPIEHDGIPHFHVPDNYPAAWPWRTFDAPGYPQPIIYATDLCPRERTYCAVGVSEAIDIFQVHSFADAPLFLRLSLDRPHTPVSSPKPYDTMYATQTTLPVFSDKERMAQIPTLRNYIHARRWDQFTDDEILYSRSYYYGLVTHLDAEIGRLLDLIELSPQRENTIIVLAADHGCMLGEHGLYVKCPHYYTETARVPLIIAWPGQ
ncbi:MAG: sulfatase-like hydrolase/transferase, partial [Caldilineaceae bacterium]|nr:sulfatase-like hydrolase/transferase [Caldilineaceae bacterium]